MKKILFSLFAVAALCAGFASCDDDDDDINRGTHKASPAANFEGVYTGYWSVFDASNVLEQENIPGSITVTKNDSVATIVTLILAADGISAVNGKSGVGNIAWVNNDAKISNANASNGFGSVFSADITDAVLSFKFSLSVRSGRSTVTKFYQFKSTEEPSELAQ
ncbi:MAG: hypothetical protein IJP70_11530 [Bacteroidales bacterium]|nr:hypothetical protein [Bacteroidales bacterium]